METRPPTFGRIAIAAGFALSCFGLLLFLWLAFGGPVPLKSKSYRFDVHFDEASQLAVESDVRISGVSVGKVKGIELADDGLADATIEIDPKYAPIPSDTRTMLRQKTLLGETYVELTPGNSDAPPLPEDGTLPNAQVSDAVQLDEIFRAFDEPTRAAFQEWMADAAVAFKGRGIDLNAALGNLDQFAERGDDLLRVLDTQRLAVKKLLADGGTTFNAISKQPDQLRGLINNTESVFSTTAARDEEIRQIFQALPTFLDESKLTLDRLAEFSTDTNPLVTQLQPVARQLSGTFLALQRLSPELERFFVGLKPVIKRAEPGFSSLRTILDNQLPPFLGDLEPAFNQLIPILDTVNRYRADVTAFLGNTSSALNAVSVVGGIGKQVKILRATGPLGPGVLASPPSPYKTSRINAYMKSGGYSELAQGLKSFYTAHCTGGQSVNFNQGDLSNDLWNRTQLYALGGAGITNTDNIAAPPCTQQGKISSIGGPPNENTNYQHVNGR